MRAGLAAATAAALAAGCATTSGDGSRLERRVRALEDEVYRLGKDRDELEARLRRLEGAEPAAGRPEAATPPPGRTPVEAVAAAGEAPEPGAGRPADADRSWQRASELHRAGRWDEAVRALEAFRAGHPADTRNEDAQFLIAECRYAQGNFPQAVVEYQEVFEAWPAGARAPQAMHKLALAYYELGDEANALRHLDRLAEAYPRSAAAAEAAALREKLRRRRR